MLEINWNMLPTKFKFAAMDADGEIWVFTHQPIWNENYKEWEANEQSEDWEWLACTNIKSEEDCSLAIEERP